MLVQQPSYQNIFKILRFCTNIIMFGTTPKKGCFISMFRSLAPVPYQKKLCSMFPMCSLSHSPMFPNNSAVCIISCSNNLVIYVVIALGWQALELRHLHHALATPSLLVLTTATTMDIFRTTFTGFEEQFDYSKKCM